MSTQDYPPQEPSLDDLEMNYSSTAPEELDGIGGKKFKDMEPEERDAKIAEIPGDTMEEKQKNLDTMPKVDARFKREVGQYMADIARGWDEETDKVYESLKIDGAIKTAEVPEIGKVAMKNVRVGQERLGKEVGALWGDAEFDELPEIPKKADYETLLNEARSELKADPTLKEAHKAFAFNGHEVNLQVSSEPRADWGGKDFHLWGKWSFKDLPEIFKAKLPALSLEKTAPAERPLVESHYAFKLQRIEANLDDDFQPGAGKPRGRLKFNVEVGSGTEAPEDTEDATPEA